MAQPPRFPLKIFPQTNPFHRSQVTSDSVGLRSLLADAGRRGRSSCGEIFEDPTYTAELAQREILVPLEPLGKFGGELGQ